MEPIAMKLWRIVVCMPVKVCRSVQHDEENTGYSKRFDNFRFLKNGILSSVGCWRRNNKLIEGVQKFGYFRILDKCDYIGVCELVSPWQTKD